MMAMKRFVLSKSPVRLKSLLNLIIGAGFLIAILSSIWLLNGTLHRQALRDAREKYLILLNHNLAIHNYFSQDLKPGLFDRLEGNQELLTFDPIWMSSSYAVRRIDQYFRQLGNDPDSYYYKDSTVNARSPENEADEYERTFIQAMRLDPNLIEQSAVRKIDGQYYLQVMRRGEVMEQTCLRCHGDPNLAPAGLTDVYGTERGFRRVIGEAPSAVSIRIPLSKAYSSVARVTWHLAGVLTLILIGLFALQSSLTRWLVFAPLERLRAQAINIAFDPSQLGVQIPLSYGKEISGLTQAFNVMSLGLKANQQELEERVRQRTLELEDSQKKLQTDIQRRQEIEAALTQAHEQLRMLTQQVVSLQEGERWQISHELHDEIGQLLTILTIKLEMLSGELPPTDHHNRQNVAETMSLVNEIMEKIHYLALGLRPPALETLGLNLTLKGLCQDFSRRTQTPIDYQGIEGILLSDEANITLYRLLQEGLTNIARHAQARSVRVTLARVDGAARLEIEDDGVGMQVRPDFVYPVGDQTNGPVYHLGLSGMKERFELLHGRIEIDSEVGRGTKLVGILPTRRDSDD